ncbi:tetratricopeptide repeat protein [Marinobacter subterrani]|uniref:Tetratricopeptide repeat protein n=1 Tax=Marinobacter subterrani TaxID=1658765 RepID=A0A0J7J7B2_9GAMM|nr:hypothetical protein [Marinobacter subterrani]KMQ74403.1 hypothetical protein Msub_10586 [Marinobacter subterrani]
MSNEIVLMENRQLVPRWHTSRKTIALQFPAALNNTEKKIKKVNDPWLAEARLTWKTERSIISATELNASLYLNEMTDDEDYHATEKYLLDNISKLSAGLADALEKKIKFADNSDFYSIDIFKVRSIIGRLKKVLKSYPRDWMTWSDIGFYYALLGEDERAQHCLTISSNACPSHPFILRSHARFLVHIGEPERAVTLFKKSGLMKESPLIASGALAISQAFELSDVKVSDCKRVLKYYSGDPVFSSDLAASLGTVEFKNGNIKKAKEFFRSSLAFPSENATAQYGWLHHKYGFTIDNSNPDNYRSIESQVNELYVNSDFLACRSKLMDLHRFQPFTEAPLTDAGYISLLGLDDPQFVVNLSSNRISRETMSFGELNNLIVAKLMLNDFSGIEDDILVLKEKCQRDTASDQRGIFMATAGMFMFKINNYDEGRFLYESAIEHFGNRNSMKAVALAKYFYAQNLEGSDQKAYEKLMSSAANIAKRHSMHELTRKDSLLKYISQ